jgi:C-terminal processing protease CtpA/Prc
VAYRKNALAGAGLAVRAPMHVVDFRPAPAVAILIGANTISSGEAVAIAFRGRPGTRTFGTATAGLPTSPRTYRLADGASIRFSSYWGTDRLGRDYRHAIHPEVHVREDFREGDRPVRAAGAWLRGTQACRASR